MENYPWVKDYDEGVPHSMKPYPQRTLLDVVMETARQRPNHPVLIFKGVRLSYAQFESLSDAFAAALFAQGVKKGDRVALVLPNSPQAVIAQFAVWKTGGMVVPLNPLYTERELEHALNECEAKAAVVLTPFYTKIKTLQEHTKLHRIIATNIKEFLPPVLRFLFTLFKEKKEGHRISLEPGDLWMDELLEKYKGASRPEVPVAPDDLALLLFSGGTTGTPKGAVGTHHALIMAGMQLHAWFGSVVVDWNDVIMLAMPLFHVYANVGILATALIGRNPLAVVPNPRDLNDLVSTIQKVGPAFLPGVPTLFIALLNHKAVKAGKVDFKSMKLCISGAAPLLAETKKRFENLTGGCMVEAYGLTESMLAAIISPVHGTYKTGAVGIPLPDVEVRIADAETGQGTLPAGEVGEILIQAPQLMKCYWQQPEETAETIKDGWLHTGDLGYMDRDGYVFIVDRKKDVIKPGGFQVWPREVEEVIASYPAVAEVGVAGVTDDYQGEAVKAWVVLHPGKTVTAEEIKSYCREKLAAYKVPKHIEFRESLPKTMIGKVLRRELSKE